MFFCNKRNKFCCHTKTITTKINNNNDKDISGSCRTNNKDMNPVNMHAVCAQIRLIMKKLLETFDGVPGENLLGGGGRECIK